MIIVQVEGNIGVGKSTSLEHAVARRRAIRVVAEPVCAWTEHLRGLYESKHPGPWPLLVQMLVEGTRMEAMFRAIRSEQEVCDEGGERPLIVVERSSASSSIFSNLTLSNEELSAFELVQSRYKDAVQARCLHANVRASVVTVYLRASPETCHRRMRSRSRDVETQITIEFLRDLHRAHDATFLKDGAADLVVDCDDKSCAEVADALCEFLGELK